MKIILRHSQPNVALGEQWYATENNEVVAKYTGIDMEGKHTAIQRLYNGDIEYNDGTVLQIRRSYPAGIMNAFSMFKSGFDMNKFVVTISEDSTQTGQFVREIMKRESSIGGPYFYELTYNNETFSGYEIGMDPIGLFFYIYKDDEVVGFADAVTKVINGQAEYSIYSKTDEYKKLLILFVILYDTMNCENQQQIYAGCKHSTWNKATSTRITELMKKFDVHYYEDCKKMYGER